MECSRWIITYILASVAIVLFLYKYLKDTFDYWRVRRVPCTKICWFFGDFYDVFFGRVTLSLLQFEIYRKLAPHKFGGYFQFHTPFLLVRDPELIKKVLTKDFQYFHDRGIKVHPQVEPLTQQLFFLNGEQWKNLRIKLTPTFSSGKMKTMIPLIEECALELVSLLNNNNDDDDERSTTNTTTSDINNSPKELGVDKIDTNNIDIKDLLTRYMGDAIASCAFGIETGIIRNPNSVFRTKAKKILDFRYKFIVRLLFPNISAKLIKLFDLRFFTSEVTDFYTAVVKDMIEYREKNQIVRNDFLNLMLNLKNNFDLEQARKEHDEIPQLERLVLDGNKKETSSPNIDMTLDIIASQCFLFLGAAFEMTGIVMTFALFEVARHPEVDEKLKKEIDDVLDRYDGQLTYYALKDMKYLDMVLAETLRMYPAAPAIMRSCAADYKLDDSDLVIPKGCNVVVSVMGLHYDKQYYPNPEEFNPENFNEQAKSQRHQYAYLPFGEGPRVCIAERFAKLQIKIAMVHLIKNYEFRLSPKMQLPIEFENNIGFLAVKGGIWLQSRPRE